MWNIVKQFLWFGLPGSMIFEESDYIIVAFFRMRKFAAGAILDSAIQHCVISTTIIIWIDWTEAELAVDLCEIMTGVVLAFFVREEFILHVSLSSS